MPVAEPISCLAPVSWTRCDQPVHLSGLWLDPCVQPSIGMAPCTFRAPSSPMQTGDGGLFWILVAPLLQLDSTFRPFIYLPVHT